MSRTTHILTAQPKWRLTNLHNAKTHLGPCEEVEGEANRHSTGHCSVRLAGGGQPRIADKARPKKVVQQTPCSQFYSDGVSTTELIH
ncbi:hypothetical protein FOZ61_001985 [Perkinsus olseni]|uniref:Uncharacterized protein n=1 Tax=Perkinsus olseni TaxID=32597 RepID=A0A7J6LUR8_PEROL|nr:hypothetical protein FOZ61_001985 [Perkinsus olseni]